MNDQPQRAETIFNAAIELATPAERAAYLMGACRDDDQLRQRVEALLQDHERAGTLLETSITDNSPQGSRLTVSEDASASRTAKDACAPTPLVSVVEKPGDRIGRYKLLQQIGEGGCGIVYMAEQEEPIRRRVALKVIKLGMDTRQVIARFEAERQALALMDHPNIAKVLDAGASEAGRPFFVMELVRGVRITEYCDQNNLPTTERLNLFTQVCQAIQHAHQKGIIHRDIKPSNILVTPHDGVPVPKVIDFGIAKATNQQRLTDKTVFTEAQQFLGTPAYMSPEQAEMSSMDIDTRSDIYSLGVLLYELLTGKTPFEARQLFHAGLDEIRRIIREVEPPRPSTRLTSLSNEELTTVAKHRRSEAPKLISRIRGELDWIVMKCLEKDRTRRYETANGLAMDILRHLNNEPLVAAAPSAGYRFRKFARRNRTVLATLAVILTLLATGVVVSTWQAVRATRAESRAKAEANKSKQVAAFLQDMLQGVGPSVARGRDTTLLREILDKTAERVGRDLKNQPDVEADLRSTIGKVYKALGQYEKAAAMHREALAMRRKLFGNEHSDVAASLNNLAVALWSEGKLAEAETIHREALAMRRKLFGNQHADVAASLNNLAIVFWSQGKLAEAETAYRESLAMRRKLFGNEHSEVAASLNNLANVLGDQGKLAEAEAMLREALVMQQKLLGNEHPDLAASLNTLATVLARQNKLAEAESMFREELAMQRKLLGNEHSEVALSLNNLASALQEQGKLAEAEALQREALAMQRRLLGNEHQNVALSLDNLASVLRRQDKLAGAETMHREALAMQRKLLGREHTDVARTLNNLADALAGQGKLAEAEALLREALAVQRKLLGNEHSDVALSLNNLAAVLKDQGRLAEAESLQRQALTMRRKLLANDDPDVAVSISDLIVSLLAREKYAEAEPLARECLDIQRKKLPDIWQTFYARSLWGASLLGQKKSVEAEPLLLSGYEGMKQRADGILAADRLRLTQALERLVQLYQLMGRPEQAAEWKQKLEAFQKTEAEKKSGATPKEPSK